MWNYFNGIFHPPRLHEPKLNCGAWEDEHPISNSSSSNPASITTIPANQRINGGSPVLAASQTNNRLKNKTPSPSPVKRSDPLSSLSVAAAAAASTLRHSFNVTTGHHQNNYNLNHSSSSGLPDATPLKGSFKGRGRIQNGLGKQRSNATTPGNENCCTNTSSNHGRFQRTLSLDGSSNSNNSSSQEVVMRRESEPEKTSNRNKQQMPQSNGHTGGGGKNAGKNKRLMFSGSKFSQNSLSFDMRDSSTYSQQHLESAVASLKKSHSEHDSAPEEDLLDDVEEGVVLRKKQDFDVTMTCDECDGVSRTGSELSDKSNTGILSTLISTSQRNSQLRSTLSKARHHLSFEKWRSSSSHSHQYQQQQQQLNQSATPNSQQPSNGGNGHLHHQQDCNNSANSSNHSQSSSNTPPTPSESPGGRLSRWFSIRRGSSHHYDLNGGSGGGGSSSNSPLGGGGGSTVGGAGGLVGGSGCGRDVRDGGSSGGSSRLNSINNEHELALQIQQQLHQSLSKVISQANALQQLQQQSAAVTCNVGGLSGVGGSSKMPLVAETDEESYNSFGLGMSYRTTTSTLKATTGVNSSSSSINPSQLLTPMPPTPPAGLSQQQLKRRHIVAAIAHSEISYVATLSRLVNDYKRPLEEGLPAPMLNSTKINTLFYRLPEIYHCHSLFRIGLMDAVRNWDAEERIGDVFMAAFSKPVVLDIYSGFINNFSVAMELAKMETKRKSALADFFRLQQMNAHDRLSFFGLMVKPVQRFPQFILFLQDLLKYTPHGHPDRMSLQLALTQLESLAETLNERKREAEQHQAFKEMLSHISGTFNTRFLSSSSSDGNRNRYLIREDDVTQLEFNPAGMVVKSKRRRLLLLNDKVICVSVAPKQSSDFGATEKLSFKWMYPVVDVEIQDNNTSVTLSRILTAGLNRGGSLKANTSAPNLQGHFAGGSGGGMVSGSGSVSESTSPVAGASAVHGADNLCTEMSNLMHDYEVVSRINELVGAFKGTYKELNCDVTKKMLANIQASIKKKDEEMAWLDSCCLQLTVKTKSGKEETYTFQTDNPNIKKEWMTELRLAQLALDMNNSPAWDVSDQQHVQRPLTKMPLFVKAQVVRKAQQQTEVRCGCYYSITNSRASGKAANRGGQKSTTQNYVWICTTDSSSSHITVFSFQHQQAGVLEELFSFEIAEAIVTTIEFVKGNSSPVQMDEKESANLISGDTVWMGTDTKKVLVYPAKCGESKMRPIDRNAPIQQLTSYSASGAIAQIAYHPEGVFMTTRTGSLVIFRKRSNSGAWNLDQPQIVSLWPGETANSGDSSIISRLLPINNNVYVACGRRINVLASHTGDVTKTFEVEADENGPISADGKINLMTHSGIGLWISMHQSSIISLYHTETLKHLQDINIAANVLRLTSSQFRGEATTNSSNKSTIHVTALTASRGLLWVGTNVGIALTIPLPRLEGAPIISGGISISYHAHFGSITFLLPLIPKTYPNGPLLGHPSVLPKGNPTTSPSPVATSTIAEESLKIDENAEKGATTTNAPPNIQSMKVIKVSPSNSTVSSSSNSSDGSHQPVMMTRRRTLEKQNSIDSPFSSAISSKFRAQFASSPIVLRRQRFKDSDSIRMSQTLPRSLGSSSLSSSSSAGYFSQSIHSNASSSASSEQNCCDVYGLYGDLIFVKEDYEAEDGTGTMMDGGAYESLRRSNPELIPIKVSTLDRRMRMKVSRPRSLDLSNWSVDSRSSSLYTSSGSEESMALRMLQNGHSAVSRNSSSASRKFNEQMVPHVIAEQPSPTGNGRSGQDGVAGDQGGLEPPLPQSNDHLMAVSGTATLRRKGTGGGGGKAAKGQQQLPEIAGKRTIITLTGGRGYINWRHIWYNNTTMDGSGGGGNGGSGGNSGSSLSVSHCEREKRSGSVPNVPTYPRTPNSTDPHVVIWEKKL